MDPVTDCKTRADKAEAEWERLVSEISDADLPVLSVRRVLDMATTVGTPAARELLRDLRADQGGTTPEHVERCTRHGHEFRTDRDCPVCALQRQVAAGNVVLDAWSARCEAANRDEESQFLPGRHYPGNRLSALAYNLMIFLGAAFWWFALGASRIIGLWRNLLGLR